MLRELYLYHRKRSVTFCLRFSSRPSALADPTSGTHVQALGVNVYTTGSGRLDTLARDVRLSLAMIVEYQARAAR